MKEKLLKFLEEQNKKEKPGYNQGVDVPIVFEVKKDQKGNISLDGNSKNITPYLADIENLIEVEGVDNILFTNDIPEDKLEIVLPKDDSEVDFMNMKFTRENWTTLKEGSSGELVRELKSMLNTILEDEIKPLKSDDIFDAPMKEAVKVFQEDPILEGLEVSGEIDYNTLESICFIVDNIDDLDEDDSDEDDFEEDDFENEDLEEEENLEEEYDEDMSEILEDYEEQDDSALANNAITNIKSYMIDNNIDKCKVVLNYNIYQYEGEIFIIDPMRSYDYDLNRYGELMIKKLNQSIGL